MAGGFAFGKNDRSESRNEREHHADGEQNARQFNVCFHLRTLLFRLKEEFQPLFYLLYPALANKATSICRVISKKFKKIFNGSTVGENCSLRLIVMPNLFENNDFS